MTLHAGMRVGPYEIVAPLGAGGMGQVYRGRDTRLDRAVAIKVLTPHAAGDPAAAGRLAREARAVAAVSHPNVLGIFDVGVHDGIPFVVTELLEGATLRVAMAEGAMEPGVAVRHAVQIAHGLAAAHDKGIVHRDLKPENIFVTHDGRLKILDFGLARKASAPASDDETHLGQGTNPGVVMGTAGYMSPEQARGQVVDHRSDIFTVGTILFEMLAGRRAFRGETMADTMAAVVRDDPPDLLQLNASVPAALARIIGRCLAKSPAERFHSSHDLALALEAISGAGTSVSAPAPAAAGTEKGIVVLPFENMSADADNEFFADGLTEEIISDLSKIHDLRVISRTSAMQLKGRKGNLPALARELRVRYVLEGSVRKAGERLRISAQLIDAASDRHLWSERYNGTLEDVFDIQERVARAIAEALRVKLTPEESREIANRPIADPAAYECYLRARAGIMRFTEEGLRAAIRDIEQGLRLAGDNALLLSVKGEAEWQLFNVGVVTDPAQLHRVREIARRIETIAPGSPHAERLLGLAAVHSGRPAEGIRRLRAALGADSADTLALGIVALCSCALGRLEIARPIVARMEAIDPLEPVVVGMAGLVEFLDGRFEAAAVIAGRGHAMAPLNPLLTVLHAQPLAALGRVSEAIAICETLERELPDDKLTWFPQAFRWGLLGDAARLAASLTPERRAWAAVDPQYPLWLAEAFALADRPDEAFEWLGTMMRTGAVFYPFVSMIDPFLSKLRADPRWPALVDRLRAAWEQVEI